jgi:mRNA interferase RelE/StbE
MTMSYQVSFRASADKAMDKLPKAIQARMIEKATALSDDPRPPGCVKLAGIDGHAE